VHGLGAHSARWEYLAGEKGVLPEPISRESLFQRILLIYQANSFEAALAELNKIEGCPPAAFPENYKGDSWIDELYFHRGICYFRLKQYSKAVEIFNLVVRNSRSEGGEKSSGCLRPGPQPGIKRPWTPLPFSRPYPKPFDGPGSLPQGGRVRGAGSRISSSSYRNSREYPRVCKARRPVSAGWVYISKKLSWANGEWDRLRN
jgi:tetratricopeptide (TPR) repeat protein